MNLNLNNKQTVFSMKNNTKLVQFSDSEMLYF